MSTTAKVGEVAEAIILAEFVKRGVTVLTPFGYAHRYDFVLDIEGKFYRVQCKSGRIRNGGIVFNSCSCHTISHKRQDYRGQVEFFAVWEPESQQLFLISPEEVGRAIGCLRLSTKKQTDLSRIKLAENYTVDKILSLLRV